MVGLAHRTGAGLGAGRWVSPDGGCRRGAVGLAEWWMSARGGMYIYIPNSDFGDARVYFLPYKGNCYLTIMMRVWNVIKRKSISVEISTI